MTGTGNELTASQAARAIRAGATSSERLVEACLARIKLREPDVQAWEYVDERLALEQARRLDREAPLSRLHGIPVGIKDVIDTADQPTRYGSPLYSSHRPKADAACVALLRRAGCVVLGKTVTTEFANISPAKTRNPRNLSHSPGGSSSGSAAAVADSMIPIALGTQTAGSVIRPAAYCGIYACKPTLGAVNRAGMKFLAESMDTIGLMARSVEDLEALLEILSGIGPLPADPTRPRIGVSRAPHWEGAEPHAIEAVERAATALSRAGSTVSELRAPLDEARLIEDHKVVMGFESARALAWEYDNGRDRISPGLEARLEAGWDVSRTEYERVLAFTAVQKQHVNAAFEDLDVLLTLSAPGEAPNSPLSTGESTFNRAWTALGVPTVTIPFTVGRTGLPLGVQLIGRAGHDAQLLGYARWAAGILNGAG